MFNPLKYFTNRKVGVVLGSGGAKGISHIAVMEYIDQMGIPVSYVAGSSIGSIIGAVYCAGKLAEFKQDLISLDRKAFLGYFDPMFPISGLLDADSMMDFIRKYIPDTMKLEDLPIELNIVATDFSDGSCVVFKQGSIIQAIRASISIPGVFQPVPYEDTFLIDGGVANPLPLDILKEMGAGITIAVNLHPAILKKTPVIKPKKLRQPKPSQPLSLDVSDSDKESYVSFLMDKAKGLASFGKGLWLKSIGSLLDDDKKADKVKLPNIFSTLMQSVDIMGYMNTVLMLKYEPPTVLIEPNLLKLKSLEFNKALLALQEGQTACEKVKNQLIRKVKWWI